MYFVFFPKNPIKIQEIFAAAQKSFTNDWEGLFHFEKIFMPIIPKEKILTDLIYRCLISALKVETFETSSFSLT